jgi:catechol 2,3-dioxygenase-like lactoylglutathione lyase family enzyme
MTVLGTHHTGFQVGSLERSLAFYRDLLGLEQISERTITKEYVGRLVGYPGVTLHSAFLRIPGSEHLLELIEYQGVERAAIDARTANPGTAHICLLVDDLEPIVERLTAAGFGSAGGVVSPTHGPNKGRLAVYLIDPDGIRVELLQ